MLTFKEKEDFEARFAEVESLVSMWRIRSRSATETVRTEFDRMLLVSMLFHDSALDGEVVTQSEIQAAFDTDIPIDAAANPDQAALRDAYLAFNHADEMARGKKKIPVSVDLIKEIYGNLMPALKGQGVPYRKENPLHRLYYHEISPPEKINYRMRKLGEWFEEQSTLDLHPISRATQTHWRLMAIFPWLKRTGKTARILSNLILRQEDYPVAVIHSIDRQRYYEALRASDTKNLLSIYLEAVENTANAALSVFDEAEK